MKNAPRSCICGMSSLLVRLFHAATWSNHPSARQTHLPQQIRFDYNEPPDNELVYYIKSRFQLWQVIISRPVLYHMAHRLDSDACQQRTTGATTTLLENEPMELAKSIARHCISTSADIILQYPYHHRHGGTWMACHGLFAQAMNILAAALSLGQVELPPDWPEIVKVAHHVLLRWSQEAADIDWMRTTLLHSFTAVCHRLQIQLGEDFWSNG